jgi:uncharacterized repeat protein (TIGR03803 family)
MSSQDPRIEAIFHEAMTSAPVVRKAFVAKGRGQRPSSPEIAWPLLSLNYACIWKAILDLVKNRNTQPITLVKLIKIPHGLAPLSIATASLLILFQAPLPAGPVHELVWPFGRPPIHPGAATLVPGPDGYFWGTTEEGGAWGAGTVYKVRADGSEWRLIVSLDQNNPNHKGFEPRAALVNDGVGFLWGTTNRGGENESGTIFKVRASDGELVKVLDFNRVGPVNTGAHCRAELVSDGAGYFWGTTREGGSSMLGRSSR